MKLKKYLYYLISLICSVYISYLICRINTLSIKSIIFITFVVGGIFEYITYLYIKNIQRKKITQKVIFLILIVSLIISGIVIKLNWKFFTSKFQPTSITIYSDDEDIVISNVIKNVIIDNIVYNIQGNHLINSNVLETNLEDKIYNNTNNLVIEFSKCSDIKIIFNSNTDEIHIKDGNNIIENINTCEDGYEYKVQSNIVKNNSFMIQLIMSELVLTYITFFTILLIKCVKNEKRYFIIAIIIAILGMWFYYTKYYIGILFPDSPGYIIYNFNEMFHLKFQSRTPIYPVIIRICQIIFDNQYIKAVVLAQYSIWFISIIFFFKTLKLLIKNVKIVTLVTIMYELCPAIIGWNNSILTESIALSVTIIIIYFIIKYIKYPNISSGMPAIILSLILTFHRPTAIIYVVLLEIFWIGRFIFDRKQIKVDFKCFIASTISIFIIVVYAIIFHRTFEIYSITDAVVRQDLIVCIQEGYYKSSNNEQFIEYVNEALKNNDNSWYVMTDVKSKYNNAEVKELTNYCRMQNMSKYIKYIYDLTIEHETIYYDNYLVNTRNTVDVALFKFITFSHIYAIIAIEFILVVYYWIKDKKVPWVHCGLFGFPFVIVFSSFVGTCGEFMRTSICALPFAYISIATYIDMLSKNKEGKNNDRIIEEE